MKLQNKTNFLLSKNYSVKEAHRISLQEFKKIKRRYNWMKEYEYFCSESNKNIPNKKFNVNFDLGTYYLTKPKTDITGSGLLKGNSSQSGQLQSNLKDYRWLPVVQLNFNFKL